MKLTDMVVPLVIGCILLWGLVRKVNITEEFTAGAAQGLRDAAEIVPILVLLMTAVGMFTASGAADIISSIFGNAAQKMGFPQECLPLVLIRPVSGSGALAAADRLLATISPDSFEGRVASVLMASTETTFYTIAVYSGALRKKADSRIFIAAAAADITGFVLSALTVRLMFR